MTIEFKIASKKDTVDILALMEAFNAIDNYPFDKVKVKANLLVFLGDPNLGRAWLINYNNLVIGYIILAFGFSFEYGGRDAFIDELFLKPEYRQKGIGRLSMDFIEVEAIKLGIKVIHLELEQHNEGGAKLYRQKGFKHNGRLLLSKKIIQV